MLILATSTETVAFIAAAAALLGGVLGAIAGGLSDYFLQRRSEKARARAGARLLRSDLRVVAGRFGAAADEKAWFRWWGSSVDSWDDYRYILAASIDTNRWNIVERGVSRILQIESNFATAEQGPSRIAALLGRTKAPLDPQEVADLRSVQQDAKRAYDALAHLAKGPVAGENFGTSIGDKPPEPR
jgi:hypothetical protein